jgi:hypothetical protein
VDRGTLNDPFSLELEVLPAEKADGGPRLHALVHCLAKTGKRIFIDHQLQPIELVLVSPAGKPVVPFDERSRKKFDTTRHKYLFRVLGPSSEYVAREDAFVRVNGAWELRFGSFTFSGMTPGRYRARIRFTSEGTQWQENGKSGEYEDLWEGTVESPEIEIVLP